MKPAFGPKVVFPVPSNLTAVQPTQQAAVPASISLDPGVGTGNQTSPGADAGGKAYSVTTQRYGRSDLDGIFNVQVPEGFVPRAEREAAAAGGSSGGRKTSYCCSSLTCTI